jgi:hypothetical protein
MDAALAGQWPMLTSFRQGRCPFPTQLCGRAADVLEVWTGPFPGNTGTVTEHERTADPARERSLDELVDAASIDSFPASDPPPWWSGAGRARPAPKADEPPPR